MSSLRTVLNHPPPKPQHSQLLIGLFLETESLTQAVLQCLDHDRFSVTVLKTNSDFFKAIHQEKQHLDCLILQGNADLPQIAKRLHGQATLLPAVLVAVETVSESTAPTVSTTAIASHAGAQTLSPDLTFIYHTAEVWIMPAQCNGMSEHIEHAISQFLGLSPTCRLSNSVSTVDLANNPIAQNFLMQQQRRLSEKLKERLGYLSVYYKRNPRNFFRYMAVEQQQETLDELRTLYREIVLHYFHQDDRLNQRIDEFVNSAFFADIATSQVVEIHMDLMDEFAKQLKLEGRSEDVLLDYRLTLIDIIAHLCEMYRRSIPREA